MNDKIWSIFGYNIKILYFTSFFAIVTMSDPESYIKIAIKNLNRVEKLMKSENLAEAQEIVQSALEILRGSHERIKYAEACYYMAEILRIRNDLNEAAKFYFEAAKIYSDLLLSDLTASMLKDAINAFQYINDIASLKEKIDEALNIARPVCFKLDIASILSIAGNIFYNKRKWNDSITYFLQAVEIGGNGIKGIEHVYYKISSCFFQLCKWVDSILNGKIVLGLIDTTKNPTLVIPQTILISRAYMRLFDYDNAMYYSSKAVDYFDRSMDPKFAVAYLNHLEINYFFKKIQYASRIAEKYLETLERLQLTELLPELLWWVGKIETELNRDNAINYFNEAIEKSKNQKNYKIEQAAAIDLARILISYGRIGEATDLINQYESMAYKSNDPEIMAEFFEKKGLIEYMLKNYEPALNSFIKSAEYYKQSNNLYEETNALYNCACIYNILGKEKELYPLLQRIVQIDIRFAEMARSDPDFASRYNDPDFINIVGQFSRSRNKN